MAAVYANKCSVCGKPFEVGQRAIAIDVVEVSPAEAHQRDMGRIKVRHKFTNRRKLVHVGCMEAQDGR